MARGKETSSSDVVQEVAPRARSFRDIVGQERAIESLRKAVASGRVHHAWIFSGPMGVGKFTSAMAFAAMLLDPTTGPNLSGEIEPDPESATQSLIARRSHPDLHVITKELARFSERDDVRKRKLTNIPREVLIERLIRPIGLAAQIKVDSLAQKVFIVDEAELMWSGETQNALLKTLEEPPPGSVIILVTSDESVFLPTIRSRCRRVVFGTLDEKAMKEWLSRAELPLTGEEREWVLEYAGGSPGRALLAAKTGLFAWAQRLTPMLEAAEAGRFTPEMGRAMKELVSEWAEARVKEQPNSSKEAANQAAIGHLFNMIAERSRRKIRERSAAGDLEGCEPELKALESLADAERHLYANVNIELGLELLAAGLAAGRG